MPRVFCWWWILGASPQTPEVFLTKRSEGTVGAVPVFLLAELLQARDGGFELDFLVFA